MTTTTSHPPSLSERIATGIVDLIRTRGLGPGDALDSSRELARRFEVTTPTIREALRRLEATDVIQFRHGSGTYVGEGITRRLLVNPHIGEAQGLGPVLELVEARLILEPQIAAAAALRRTPAQLADLAAASDNALVPQRGEERPTLNFHVALAAASGNQLVGETIEALLRVRSKDQVAIRRHYTDRDRDHAEHLAILQAVRDQDPDLAADLARGHLESIREAIGELASQEATS